MTELPFLPPRPAAAWHAPAGALEAVVTRGRRRRRLATGAGGGAAAVVLVAAVLAAAPGGAGGEGLRYAEHASSAAPTAPEDDDRQSQPSAAAPAAAAEPHRGRATTAPAEARLEQPPAPAGSKDHQDAPSRERRAYVESPRDTAAPPYCKQPAGHIGPGMFVGPVTCNGGNNPHGRVKSGGTVEMTLHFCVADGPQSVALSFPSGQEHELVVNDYDTGETVFRFSETVTYPEGAHSRVIKGGRCLVWTAVWDTTTTDGHSAPPGHYTGTFSLVNDRQDGTAVPAGQAHHMRFDVTVYE